MRHTAIISTGHHVPQHEVSNDELRQRFELDNPGFVDKMESKTGIGTRFYAPKDWATSDLALPAAQQALERAGCAPEDLDLILLGTDSPDYVTPATSTVLQHKLGAKNAGTFDVGCACASFPTALATAAGLIQTNESIKKVLVVGVYLMHRLADPKDPMVFFYGDGAGAALVSVSDEPGVFGATFSADGSYAGNWGIYSGGTAEPATEASIREGRTAVRLLEPLPRQVNDDGWPALLRRLAEEKSFELADVDLFVFTQVRRATIELVMDRIGAPMERTHMVMEKWGYTGSACIPMALHDAIVTGRAKPGDLVVMIGSGVGLNQAAVAVRLTDDLVTDGL